MINQAQINIKGN